MKKGLSIVLTAALCAAQSGFAFADDAMQNVLISVKNRVDIPAELTEFVTSTGQTGNKNEYRFEWSDKENNRSISVEADSAGHILNYSEYNDKWYKDDDSAYRIDKDFKISDLENFAQSKLEKMAPELFSDENDKLVMTPYDGSLSLYSRSSYSFGFERKHDGITVADNEANVSVMNTKDGYVISYAYINWDYETGFKTAENMIDEDAAKAALLEKSPVKLRYRKNGDDKYFLEYVSNGKTFIDAESGEEVKEDINDDFVAYAKSEMAAEADSGAGAKNSAAITPREQEELDKVDGLKSRDELLSVIYSMPELDVEKPADSEKIRSHTYKIDDKYFTYVTISEESSEKDGKMFRPTASVNAYFDAKTGELLSFNRYSYDIIKPDSSKEKKDNTAALEKADTFLEKYFADKTAASEKENGDSVFRVRLVNDIPYGDNYITASWDGENNRIDSFSCRWDEDVSKMPKPENIISAEDAAAKMFAKYPIELRYIKSDKKYVKCWTFSEIGVNINAFDGKIVGWDGEEVKDDRSGTYSDIDGHWIKDIAKKLADYGIAIDGDKLRPDEEITQAEFLKLVYSGMSGSYYDMDIDWLYRRMNDTRVLPESENASDEKVTRENAIRYLLRAMGIRDVAEIKGIYICDFADRDDISDDKIGYCAIAKGFGIVSGSDGYLKPQDNITRAEALAMLYNYLTR